MIKLFSDKLKYNSGYGAVLARGALRAFIVKITGAGLLFCLHVMLAQLIGVDEYGIYVYAITWINILTILCLLGSPTSLVRFIAEYKAKQQWNLLKGIVHRSNQIVLAFSILVGIIATAVTVPLKERISVAAAVTFYIVPLLILLTGQVVNALAGSVGLIMAMTNHQNLAGAIIAVSTAANIALNALLIPLFGLTGAAISTAFTMALWNIAMLTFVQRRLGINSMIL